MSFIGKALQFCVFISLIIINLCKSDDKYRTLVLYLAKTWIYFLNVIYQPFLF